MKRASVRDLHLNTSGIIKEIVAGQSFLIMKNGEPVAELRPIMDLPSTRKLPDREAFIRKLPQVKTDSGRILEEDRS
jgi:antitoxin (DNA-binding transcriptional repressor) of toxin-antitoxin stability system